MSGKFMKIKRIIIPAVALVIMASQLAGCAILESNEMLDMIRNGQPIAIEIVEQRDTTPIVGEVEKEESRVQLDQLKTYSEFRVEFDRLFNINRVTVDGADSKSGSMFVDKDGSHSGNTTLMDAFRNRVFIEKYWENNEVTNEITRIVSLAYTDEDGSRISSLYAALNAYYDLLTDNIEPNSFNANQSVSREQFYALVFKSTNGVKELDNDATYTRATGGVTRYSIFAQQVDEKAFLNVKENSLDEVNARGSISRAEAVYMVVNKFFPEELNNVKKGATAYIDTKDAENLALRVGFKTQKDGVITEKRNWQAFILAYMTQNNEEGMQQELFRPMVVSKQLGLLGNVTESRWDEPISRYESIQLMVNVFKAYNELNGFATKVEHGYIAKVENEEIEDNNITAAPAEDLALSGGPIPEDYVCENGVHFSEYVIEMVNHAVEKVNNGIYIEWRSEDTGKIVDRLIEFMGGHFKESSGLNYNTEQILGYMKNYMPDAQATFDTIVVVLTQWEKEMAEREKTEQDRIAQHAKEVAEWEKEKAEWERANAEWERENAEWEREQAQNQDNLDTGSSGRNSFFPPGSPQPIMTDWFSLTPEEQDRLREAGRIRWQGGFVEPNRQAEGENQPVEQPTEGEAPQPESKP